MTPTTEELAAELDELGTHLALGPNQSATLRAAAARLRELSEALKPFGEAAQDAEDLEDWEHIWENPSAVYALTAAHLRRAAQLTETHSEP